MDICTLELTFLALFTADILLHASFLYLLFCDCMSFSICVNSMLLMYIHMI